MTTHLTRIAVLAVAVESTPGTAAAPTLPTDAAIVVYEPNVTWDPTITPRDPVHSKLSKPGAIVGSRRGTVTFRTEIKGSGTAGTAPMLDVLLKGCGCSVANVVATSDIYTPDDVNFGVAAANPATVTMDFYQDKRRFRMVGCMGNPRITARSGEPGWLEFEFQGVSDPTDPLTNDDVASIAAITYESTKPPAFMGSTRGTFFATNPLLSTFELDFGNEVTVIPSANAVNGYSHARIVNRNPTGSFDSEMVENATFGNTAHGRWVNGTEGALSVILGATAGNIFTLAAAAMQITGVSPGDRDGIGVDTISFQINSALDSDAEFSLKFT